MIERVTYGSTGLQVSRVNFGVGLVGRLKYKMTPAEGGRLLRAAFDLGVNFWDTADHYDTHPHVGEALKGLDRASVVINSKTASKDRAGAIGDCERFLVELGTEYVDTVMLHGVETVEEFGVRQGALEGLIECKRRGLVKHVGLSTHIATGAIMEEVARNPAIEVVLTLYNRDGLMLKGGTLAEHVEAIRRVYEAGKGVCLMKVLAQGGLVSTPEPALRAAFEFPYAHSATIGFRDIHQVEFALRVAAGQAVEPDLAVLAAS
jgi:aryl-alcohol dehydrogenase-like predicted oxidoreductase